MRKKTKINIFRMGGNKYKKIIEENKNNKNQVLSLDDKQITQLTDIRNFI